jgi:hypothetical protein
MALQSFRRLRPNCAMSVNVFAPLSIAVVANVNMAAKGCRLPCGSRGSAKPEKSSYNDGTAAAEAFAFIIINLLEVNNRHFAHEKLGELKSPGIR